MTVKLISEWISRSGMTQREIASRSGLRQTTISKLYLRQIREPSLSTAAMVAMACGVGPRAFGEAVYGRLGAAAKKK